MCVTSGRLAATGVDLLYVLIACVKPAWAPVFFSPMSPVMPLVLIWLSESAGEFVGAIPSTGAVVTRASGELAVTLCGWAMLIGGPVLMALIYATPLDPP